MKGEVRIPHLVSIIEAQQIKDLDATARLIVSSGYSRDPVMAQYASFGFCATLVKPYSAREIARVLNKSLLAASV